MEKAIYSKGYEYVVGLLKEARGMPGSELAKLLKMDPSIVYRIDRAERRLDIMEFLQYCKAANIDPVTIIEEAQEFLEHYEEP